MLLNRGPLARAANQRPVGTTITVNRCITGFPSLRPAGSCRLEERFPFGNRQTRARQPRDPQSTGEA